jgi:hypothetical protein
MAKKKSVRKSPQFLAWVLILQITYATVINVLMAFPMHFKGNPSQEGGG